MSQTLRQWLDDETPSSRRQARMGQLWRGWLAFSSNPLAMLGLAILLVLGLVAGIALVEQAINAPNQPWIGILSGHDPRAQDLGLRLKAPGVDGFFLGSDELGRDIWSRIVHGAPITLMIVALVAVSAPVVGLLVGTAAGYLGGWIDAVLMRLTDVFLAFPKLVLALAFVAALGAGIENAILAIALTSWPPYARIARAETLTIRKADHIAAIQLQGAGPMRIIVGHIWPLCVSSLIVRVTLDMAGIILTAAGLGFLGLGAQPPLPEWGAMISAGRKFILDQWWVATMPGMAIFIVSLGFNLLGDGLRDVLDPRAKK